MQIEVKYGERTGSDCPKLGKLHSSYKWLKEGTQAPAPKQQAKEAKDQGNNNNAKFADPNYV